MKRLTALILALFLLTGCGASGTQQTATEATASPETTPVNAEPVVIPYTSRFEAETVIRLAEDGLDVTGPESLTVFASRDIIYYEDRDTYESGNPYGEGTAADKHTAEEAAAHMVVNITKPGAYRVTGKLSAGQIRVDLGEDACTDETAVVELILDNVDITCTVAPAILFLNVYECDGDWSTDTAKPDVDTTKAGANLILEGENTVHGAYVARIYKDKEGEKKLWKQDGAIYAYMSMNVAGSGALELNAENEGMDTELHLTINGGNITIRSGNDGINTNEDGVSVTTINGGRLRILAGLGEEGDGIDSNGYLVINGGDVLSSANPAADAGLDSDLGSYIHGGTVVALGSTMDWAESDSEQVTMNLQYGAYRAAGEKITVTTEDGVEVFSCDTAILGEDARRFMGAVISCPEFRQGQSYLVYTGDAQMYYTGTDVRGGPGGFPGGRPEAAPPEGFDGQRPEEIGGEPPEGVGGNPPADFAGKMPEGWDPGQRGERPEGADAAMPTWPAGEMPNGFGAEGGEGGKIGGRGNPDGDDSRFGQESGAENTLFYMQDKVNCFSGLAAVTK